MIGRILWVLVTIALVFGTIWLHSDGRRWVRIVCAVVDVVGVAFMVALGGVALWWVVTV